MDSEIFSIESIDHYFEIKSYISTLAKTEPHSDSEIADIINHLGTIADEWAVGNLHIEDRI